MLKRLLALCLGVGLCVAVFAQNAAFRDDHPEHYTVQLGDTLWDIAERFLNSPWLWPEIWYANPQIENPHLIYPGDEISLVYVAGKPRLGVAKRSPRDVIRLSPGMRELPSRKAIPTIDLSDIAPYITRPRMLEESEIHQLPYVVAFQSNKIFGLPAESIYVRNLHAQEGDHVIIARPGFKFTEIGDPEDVNNLELRYSPWHLQGAPRMVDLVDDWWSQAVASVQGGARVLAYEVRDIAEAVVSKAGNPATIRLLTTESEIHRGDLIVPVSHVDYDPYFEISAPSSLPADVQVIALKDAVFGVGTRQVVAINHGQDAGLRPGHLLFAYRPGKRVRDRIAYPESSFRNIFSDDPKIKLPDEYAGQVMVFRSFARVSYGIVVKGIKPIRIYDHLIAPAHI